MEVEGNAKERLVDSPYLKCLEDEQVRGTCAQEVGVQGRLVVEE